jgi:hypothetical protein
MLRLTRLLFVACAVLGISPNLLSFDRAHDLASQAASQKPVSCPKTGTMTLKKCRAKFPDGCSTAKTKPNYDAYLDFLKDQDPGTTAASTKDLVDSDFPALESKLTTLTTPLTDKNHSASASTFAGLGEGNIHTVIAYLYFAVDTSKGTAKNPSFAETCNCRIKAASAFDYHLGLGFDSALAKQAGTAHPKQGTALFTTLEKQSVVAEMTPATRHTKWTFTRVNALQGKQVKVVGQLMVDNVHFSAKDDCHFSDATANCWRSTVWEIHPVTQFYVCKASGGCTPASPASDWTNLDDMP